MLNKKADTIEDYILKRLAAEAGQVELKRTELAGEISCAPSQISYVLSTRFTYERGFLVESRRGLGGYIRITIVTDGEPDKKAVYDEMIREIGAGTPFEAVSGMLDYLVQNQLITRREAMLTANVAVALYRNENVAPADRAEIIRTAFRTLAGFN